ncbi:MAG: hypothetical protein KA792_02735 [Bacteroidales bacterium]|nr:hypothetical protein [Bacteroidales bacterium]
MKKIFFILFLCLLYNFVVKAQTKINFAPYFQLGSMYYSSKQVTSTGVGPGIGLSALINKHFLAKTDLNLFWINGNAASLRLALGYKRIGLWAPAAYLGISSIFGSRTEILLEDGSRPANPVFSLGLQLSPLRFENEKGFVSILEIGYGFSNYQGKNLEISLLSLGVKF